MISLFLALWSLALLRTLSEYRFAFQKEVSSESSCIKENRLLIMYLISFLFVVVLFFMFHLVTHVLTRVVSLFTVIQKKK